MPPEEKKDRVPIKSLRTYQGDVEEAIAKNNYSGTSILLAEQKRKLSVPQKETESIKINDIKNKFFIYLGLVLLFLGTAIVISIYYIRSSQKIIIQQQTKTLISFTNEHDINIASTTRANLISDLTNERSNFNLPLNSVLYINTTIGKNSAAVGDILSLIGPNEPSSLERSFDNQYMLGIYSYDTNEFFIILKVNDFASSYSGMLKWEKDMPSDLAPIFSIGQDPTQVASLFTDVSIKNKDLRVLKDSTGKTQLLYSFIDKETLVITRNEKIFDAIVSRLALSNQSK